MEIARAGDVVFKSEGGLWGRIADSFSARGEGFGHVGLVATDAAGALVVIHAGGDPVSRAGRVQATAFADFLKASKMAALYRPALDEAGLAAALAYAADAVRRAAPFDSDFSLETADRLYCTEFVWRALSAGLGDDAVPERSMRAGKAYVALDDLQRSPQLALAWRSAPAEEQSGRE